MKRSSIIGITIVVLFSCTNNNNPINPAPDKNKKLTDSFFPVTSFIKGQIYTLDSFPVTPLQLTTSKGKTDSTWLSKSELKLLLLPFLTPLINETNQIGYFKETRFNDQTLNTITFTYDPIISIPDSITLRHWDVYIEPETGKVLKIYLVKSLKEGNQNITQQLTWQTDKLVKITTISNKPDGSMELLKEVVCIWGFN